MTDNRKNIDLSQNGFADRLRTLREAAKLTQSDLAEKAGLTYRTVHDLELGKRERSQEKTIFMLAQALEVPVEVLLCPDKEDDTPVADRRKRLLTQTAIAIVALLVILGTAAAVLWQKSCAEAVWTLDNNDFVVRDAILKTRLWEISSDNPEVQACMVSPWNQRHLLVSLNRRTEGGGKLACLDRATGDTIWTLEPDIEALIRAFGKETVLAAKFSCRKLLVADFEGDGEPEVIAPFTHGKYYPSALCTVRPDGTLRAQYSHRGHIFGTVVGDFDGDGKDELLACGTNNSTAYMGATLFILDGEHCGGASVDSLSAPASTESDSALVRVVIPNYPAPYMKLLKGNRLAAYHLQVLNNRQESPWLSAQVRTSDPFTSVTAYFDGDLRPIKAAADDCLLNPTMVDWPDSLTNGTGPGDAAWLARWLSGYKRFEMGRLVSGR